MGGRDYGDQIKKVKHIGKMKFRGVGGIADLGAMAAVYGNITDNNSVVIHISEIKKINSYHIKLNFPGNFVLAYIIIKHNCRIQLSLCKSLQIISVTMDCI